MFDFLSKEIDAGKCELCIDTKIFSAHIAMKAAYTFLDRAFFFFYLKEENLVVQITPKEWQEWDAEDFALEFSDELLSTSLRDKLERDNKEIREKIIWAAIANSLHTEWFVNIDTDNPNQEDSQNRWDQIDFDKDIDEILREIENDPELKIDEEEIERILREIELETNWLEIKPEITLNTNAIKDVKEKFQNR